MSVPTKDRASSRSGFALLSFSVLSASALSLLPGCDEDAKVAPAPKTESSKANSSAEKASSSKASQAEFVGAKACASCHEEEAKLYQDSDHRVSMAAASKDSILANLKAPVRSLPLEPQARIQADGESFFVSTEGPDGKNDRFRVEFTFGADPLQQYLINAGSGQLQPLRLSWDTRPKKSGGQKWFHLYAGEKIPVGDLLHWLGPNQNYNGMCADCHSTNLRRKYDHEAASFNTTWTDINVNCEACHGPGSNHLAWAAKAPEEREEGTGFERPLRGASASSWAFESGSAIAVRKASDVQATEVDSCAPCHSRRALLKEDPRPPADLLDLATPAFAVDPIYQADGQIEDEVYIYGSFTQSKMHRAGVTCGDCHNPHSGQLRAEGNALCNQCHQAETYNQKSHHFHESGKGDSCVDCHMATKAYMEIDLRHDHSFRIPRPDRSAKFGVRNACSECHAQKSLEWAESAFKKNWGAPKPLPADFLAQGQAGDPRAGLPLLKVARDRTQPEMLRATSLIVASALPGLTRALTEASASLASDRSSLVRLAAARSSASLPPEVRLSLLARLLEDTSFAVQVESMRQLAIEIPRQARAQQEAMMQAVAKKFEKAQQPFLDRASVRMSLASIALGLGQAKKAQTHFYAGLKLDPNFVPLVINYTDFLRQAGEDARGLALLDELLKRVPDAAPAWHSKGLALVRAKRKDEALKALAEAARLQPDDEQYVLTYAIALSDAGKVIEAVRQLDSGLTEQPFARRLHQTKLGLLMKAGARERGAAALRDWLERLPTDPDGLRAQQQLGLN